MTAGTPNMEGRRVVVVGGTSGMGSRPCAPPPRWAPR